MKCFTLFSKIIQIRQRKQLQTWSYERISQACHSWSTSNIHKRRALKKRACANRCRMYYLKVRTWRLLLIKYSGLSFLPLLFWSSFFKLKEESDSSAKLRKVLTPEVSVSLHGVFILVFISQFSSLLFNRANLNWRHYKLVILQVSFGFAVDFPLSGTQLYSCIAGV